MAKVNDKRLVRAGPIDPENGYPMWFEDSNKLRLELVLNLDPLAPVVGEFDPLSPLSIPGNFPDESFYFGAEAELPVGGAGEVGRARVILHLEAAFGGDGSPQRGMNVVFARIRVRMDKVIAGAKYIVTHPYGVTKELEADDRGRVFHTEDLGIVEGDPTAVIRSGQVAPFLAATVAPPAGYIADGGIEQAITGSPVALTPGNPVNYVVIEGPNIRAGGGSPDPNNPLNMDRVSTDRFTLQGRIARRVGAWVDRTTYAVKPNGSVSLTVAARSVAQASGTASDLRVVGSGLHFALQRDGEHYVGISDAAAPPAPGDARLVNISDVPPTWFPLNFEPELVIASAAHDLGTNTLTMDVRCGDPAAALALVLPARPLVPGMQTINGMAAVPAIVEVEATTGAVKARAQRPVVFSGPPAASLPVEARVIATPVQGEVGTAVQLDGRTSAGATAYQWTGNPTAPAPGADPAQATITPATAALHSVTLTVQGSGGPKSATVNINVVPRPTKDTFTGVTASYDTRRRQFRVRGRVDNLPNRVVVTLNGNALGEPATADALGDWELRYTLKSSEAAPALGAVLALTGRINTPVFTTPILFKN